MIQEVVTALNDANPLQAFIESSALFIGFEDYIIIASED